MHQELGGKERPAQVPSNANVEEEKEFCSKLWENPAPFKKDVEWLKEVELELQIFNIQDMVEITPEDVTMQLRNMLNWKAIG